MGMPKRDARKLSSEQQYVLRETAVNMVFELGYTKLQAAESVGVSRFHVAKWCRLYEEGGLEALKLGRRGRRPGEQAKLKGWQCATVIKLISDNTPDQLKLAFVLWTAAAVRDLVVQRMGITLSLRSMRRYLQNWNFTPQKPVRKAWQQNDVHVNKWLQEEYPAIERRANKLGATILWVDETGVTNRANSQRGYSPRGQTPVLAHSGTRRKVNMISALSNRGYVRFMCYTSTMTQSKFILFLSKLIKSIEGPVIVITDNLRVHHGKRVMAWVGSRSQEISLEFIPSYSPELNADEYLNRDLKKNVNSKNSPSTVAQLKANIISFMRSIQQQPQRVISYFAGRKINYAA